MAKYREHLKDWVQQRTEELKTANEQLQGEITERQQASETLRRAAEDLARSNQDLEQFAYVASHDLQEPLRAVAGFVSLLQQRYQGKLDEKAGEYISAAVDGVLRMQALINDLLAYSRVSRGRAHEPVKVQEALDNALRNLRASIQETGAVVANDALPTVYADRVQYNH